MHSTRIDISMKIRKQMSDLLNERLADSINLGLQAKQAHWNVKGPTFIALHELFDKIAEKVEEHTDSLAERVTALGGIAEGTIAVVIKRSKLPEYSLTIKTGPEHVNALSESLAQCAKSIRQAIDQATTAGDAVTADLFTGIGGEIDKLLWFVEAHVQAEK